MYTTVKNLLEGDSPSFDEFVEEMAVDYPLLDRLADTPQDPEWHAEGDVATHTRMVIEEAYAAAQDASLTTRDRALLVLTALFHDVCKPITTRTQMREGRERIMAPRHPEKGASWLAPRVFDLGLKWFESMSLLEMVRHHQRPKWMAFDEEPECEWRKLSRACVGLDLPHLLALADIRGRKCEDKDEQLEWIELFRLQAEEYRLMWGKSGETPYTEWRAIMGSELDFEDDLPHLVREGVREFEAGIINSPWEAVGRAYEYGGDRAELVVAVGPSGSGKSTWIERNLPDFDVVGMDGIREELTGDPSDQSMNGQVRQEAQERVKAFLRNQDCFVVDATNLRRDFRKRWIDLGYDYGARVTLLVFHMPVDVVLERNRQRDRTVPEVIVRGQFESWQWPSVDEGHNQVYVGETGEVLGTWGWDRANLPF